MKDICEKITLAKRRSRAVINVTNLQNSLFISEIETTSTSKRVTMSCSQWTNVEFSYPADAIDVILLYQCLNGMEDTIQTVFYFCESPNIKKE